MSTWDACEAPLFLTGKDFVIIWSTSRCRFIDVGNHGFGGLGIEVRPKSAVHAQEFASGGEDVHVAIIAKAGVGHRRCQAGSARSHIRWRIGALLPGPMNRCRAIPRFPLRRPTSGSPLEVCRDASSTHGHSGPWGR